VRAWAAAANRKSRSRGGRGKYVWSVSEREGGCGREVKRREVEWKERREEVVQATARVRVTVWRRREDGVKKRGGDVSTMKYRKEDIGKRKQKVRTQGETKGSQKRDEE
jgi:hypothetical protein